ncbi:MAG TPA: helix-turn-helix domain-containing protein [Rhizomicrobium sp.]|nr:helix-turn-helix domain-containing protein [Rhizomicrobium sp.]
MMKESQIEIRAFRPEPTRVGLAQRVVAHAFDVQLHELTGSTRGHPRAARARQVSMYLVHVVFGMNLAEIARAFGRDPSTATHACHQIEDMREDPELDRTIGWLETQLRGAAGMPV